MENKEEQPEDYCDIGLKTCPSCGYTHDYQVGHCWNCHISFLD